VCVRKCPDKNFAFVVDRNVDGWKEKMICNYKVSVINETDAEAKIKNNICARYYLKSREGESAGCTFSVKGFHKHQ